MVFLDDETHLSQWCTHELQMAKASSVGIIVVIDADRYKQVGPLIDHTTDSTLHNTFISSTISLTNTPVTRVCMIIDQLRDMHNCLIVTTSARIRILI